MLTLANTTPTALASIPSPAALIRAAHDPGELRNLAQLLRPSLPGSPAERLGRAACRVLIAAHADCPPDVLERLGRDPDPQVRAVACRQARRLSATTVH